MFRINMNYSVRVWVDVFFYEYWDIVSILWILVEINYFKKSFLFIGRDLFLVYFCLVFFIVDFICFFF